MTRPPCFLASLTTTTMLAAGVILSPLSPPTASAEWTDALPLEEMSAGFRGVVDIAVLRPAGFARLAIGSAVLLPMSTFFNVVGLPFGRDVSVFAQDWDRFVVEPAGYTFAREVGQDLEGL